MLIFSILCSTFCTAWRKIVCSVVKPILEWFSCLHCSKMSKWAFISIHIVIILLLEITSPTVQPLDLIKMNESQNREHPTLIYGKLFLCRHNVKCISHLRCNFDGNKLVWTDTIRLETLLKKKQTFHIPRIYCQAFDFELSFQPFFTIIKAIPNKIEKFVVSLIFLL